MKNDENNEVTARLRANSLPENYCRLSLRERTLFRGAKGDNSRTADCVIELHTLSANADVKRIPSLALRIRMRCANSGHE